MLARRLPKNVTDGNFGGYDKDFSKGTLPCLLNLSDWNFGAMALKFPHFIQARIAQLVAYWLGTEVPGSDPSKGEKY